MQLLFFRSVSTVCLRRRYGCLLSSAQQRFNPPLPLGLLLVASGAEPSRGPVAQTPQPFGSNSPAFCTGSQVFRCRSFRLPPTILPLPPTILPPPRRNSSTLYPRSFRHLSGIPRILGCVPSPALALSGSSLHAKVLHSFVSDSSKY